jgi:hypothetical protein
MRSQQAFRSPANTWRDGNGIDQAYVFLRALSYALNHTLEGWGAEKGRKAIILAEPGETEPPPGEDHGCRYIDLCSCLPRETLASLPPRKRLWAASVAP